MRRSLGLELCMAWLLWMAAFGAMLYYGAILLGLYKDPMMAHFRQYGEERRIYPLSRFIFSLSGVLFMTGLMLPGSTIEALLLILSLIGIVASFGISRTPHVQAALPRWYQDLLDITTREERRAIAYAWARLPLRTRLRLNGDSYAFQVFVDEVRLTVIYGARDPDDPWATWQ